VDNFKAGFEKVAIFKTLDKGMKLVYKVIEKGKKLLGIKVKPKPFHGLKGQKKYDLF